MVEFCFRKVHITISPGSLKKASLGIVSLKEKSIKYSFSFKMVFINLFYKKIFYVCTYESFIKI